MRKVTYHNFHQQARLEKYRLFFKRLQKALISGAFFRYSLAKQQKLIRKLNKYRDRIEGWSLRPITQTMFAGLLLLPLTDSLQAQQFDLSPDMEPFGLLQQATTPAPTFGDIDGDGDYDAFVGNSEGNTRYYENVGTASAPSFVLDPDVTPFGIVNLGQFIAPNLVDIDGDGDLDLFIGEKAGNSVNNMYLYENTGTPSNPIFAPPIILPSAPSGFISPFIPRLVDIDGDSDQDIFISVGGISFYRNIGDANNPLFAVEGGTTPLGLDNMGEPITGVSFLDMDEDGDLDAVAGTSSGDFRYYENIGSSSTPSFSFVGTNLFGLQYTEFGAIPCFVDINGDSQPDALVGTSSGNIRFFMGSGFSTSTAIVPTLGQWAVIIVGLLLLIAGIVGIKERDRVTVISH